MLLYDGSLNGVTNISDSAWELGKMYSAPRESIGDLVSRADCKKYGVYLLLSDEYVYVGQAIDLERRTKQHLTDKDWWTQVVLMTTKDDSFNASDIDYLESRLIELAGKAATFDSDNKKRGNPQKVDEFRQAELEQYLDEALFLLELIGVRVFRSEAQRRYRAKGKPISISASGTEAQGKKGNNGKKRQSTDIPELPDHNMKAGNFIRTAMVNLSKAGYVFSDEDMRVLCSDASMHDVIGMQRKLPFFKIYNPDNPQGHMIDGRPRFYAAPLTYGTYMVYLNAQIYSTDKEPFIKWYNGLK